MAPPAHTLPVPAREPDAGPAPDLHRSRPTRRVPARPLSPIGCVLALWALTGALTGLGILLGLLMPALSPAGAPHPMLRGTAGEAISILSHNLRILAAPLILAAARWAAGPITRLLGDAIVAAIVIVNPLLVGAAIGKHGTGLLAYLPHVPLEWAALSTAAGAWLAARSTRRAGPSLVAYAAAATTLAAIAAVVETLAIPHAL
jgi:hypothetical protein